MKKYDFVIPIGESCITSFNLRRLGLQRCSYPFDWLMDFNLDAFYYYLRNNFSDFLIKENLVPYLDIPPTSCWHYRDIITNILFVHCFQKPYSLDESFDVVKNQFNRRIDRFIRHLKTGKSLLFIYVSKKDCYDDDYLISYLENISILYPQCVIDFVYILTVKQENVYIEQKINEHLNKIVMSYSDENLDPGMGDGNHWQGMHYLFDRALKDITVPKHNILKIVCNILSCLILIKKVKVKIRNFWYNYYYR